MRFLTKEQVLSLHRLLAERTGGSTGIRDMALLESALGSAAAGFGDTELYPTVEEKSARLGYCLVADHAFVDGNKRIGLLVMLTLLRLNGVRLRATDAELVRVGLSLADGSMSCPALLDFVRAHTEH